MTSRLPLLTLVFLSTLIPVCRGQELLVLQPASPTAEEKQLQSAIDFLGLTSKIVNPKLPYLPGKAKTLAIVASAETLSNPGLQSNLAYLFHNQREHVPLLIYGITSHNTFHQLNRITGAHIDKCDALPGSLPPSTVGVANQAALVGSLAGIDLPAVTTLQCSLRLAATATGKTILNAKAQNYQAALLTQEATADRDIFFVPRTRIFDDTWLGEPTGTTKAFSSLAPFLIFLTHVAKDYAWHLDGHYANLTIDDPWLTQPYGNLDYYGLLNEMDRHNFHTTIAFVPWNYDRSEPKTAALFRQRPDRYSIAIHGNNHAHQEFGPYAGNPFAQQVADIKQGIARMERFHSLTGIAYDRFMVFPHSMAPANTIAALHTYGFLGTANSVNVPSDVTYPRDPLFLLRPFTTQYCDLPSYFRYPAAVPPSPTDLAVQAFLGNPVLFYIHQDFFEDNISAFNPLADRLNHLQPDTQWASLGTITRHLSLIRQREDGAFDVQMLSSELDLTNSIASPATFYIQYPVSHDEKDLSLTIAGAAAPFDRTAEAIHFHLTLAPHQKQSIKLAWPNDFNPAAQSIAKSSIYVAILRAISDFRDIHLSRSKLGRGLTRNYYSNNGETIESYVEHRLLLLFLAITSLLALIGYSIYKYRLTPHAPR